MYELSVLKTCLITHVFPSSLLVGFLSTKPIVAQKVAFVRETNDTVVYTGNLDKLGLLFELLRRKTGPPKLRKVMGRNRREPHWVCAFQNPPVTGDETRAILVHLRFGRSVLRCVGEAVQLFVFPVDDPLHAASEWPEHENVARLSEDGGERPPALDLDRSSLWGRLVDERRSEQEGPSPGSESPDLGASIKAGSMQPPATKGILG